MKSLPRLLCTKSVDEILALPDFQERIEVYREENEKYKQLLNHTTKVIGDAILIDLRGQQDLPVGNRFMEYTLFPEQNISIRIVDGRNKKFAMISVGHSIINRTSEVDVGALTLRFGGGGHKKVGTCQIQYDEVESVVEQMLQTINGKG